MIRFLCFLFIVLGTAKPLVAQFDVPNITNPPLSTQIRTMAEWEEIEALVVTWTSFEPNIAEIIKHAKKEVKVLVICSDSTDVINYLNAIGENTTNVEFIQKNFNSVWIRDYGASTVYSNDVDSIYLVDWIYNRSRPFDDTIPKVIATYSDIPLYSTTASPWDLVHTGGNFMSDGRGTAFSSRLVLKENSVKGLFNPTIKTEADIDSIMKEFMGINRYIKMDTLQYDGIHHIDMHMKLLDEETLLVGEYPSGEGDATQIEANLNYLLTNYKSIYGTPYKVIRIPMPPDECGRYPDDYSICNELTPDYGYYRTYTNLVFVNKMVLVPTYEEKYDTTAFRILQEALPGYKLVGIDCNYPIRSLGAVHCITRAVGVKSPLYISHQPIRNATHTAASYSVSAIIKHQTGINSATIFYTTDTTQGYISTPMINLGNGQWKGFIPTQPIGTKVFYYIKANANSGKEQFRPMPAPKAYWSFIIQQNTSTTKIQKRNISIGEIYPNPTQTFFFLPIEMTKKQIVNIKMYNAIGQEMATIFNGELEGKKTYQVDVENYALGVYWINITGQNFTKSIRVIIE